LRVRFQPSHRQLDYRAVAVPGETWSLRVEGAAVAEIHDPQNVLANVKVQGQVASGTVIGPQGWHTLFALVRDGNVKYWEPVNVEIRPAIEILDTKLYTESGQCHFYLRNNTERRANLPMSVSWASRATDLAIDLASGLAKEFTVRGNPMALMQGANILRVGTVSYAVYSWDESHSPADPRRYLPMPIDTIYNDAFGTILSKSFWSAEYPYPITFDDMMSHLAGERNHPPDDSLLRAAVNDTGIMTTRYGIPFHQRQQGKNLVAVSRWKEFAERVEFPIGSTARKIYLMLSAITFPMQSHIANARVSIHYADGGSSDTDLVNPDTLDNGWGRFGGTSHTTPFGMVLLGKTAARSVSAQPLTILGQSSFPGRAQQFRNGISPETGAMYPSEPPEERTHADIVDLDCIPNRRIEKLSVQALSNEIILAVFGVTLLE
jgi:hypothetical protein